MKNVTLEVLNVIRETKNDDLTNTLQKIITVYQEELAELAVEMCQHLVNLKKNFVFSYLRFHINSCRSRLDRLRL